MFIYLPLQVLSSGLKVGPSGVTVKLMNNGNNEAKETVTGENGR